MVIHTPETNEDVLKDRMAEVVRWLMEREANERSGFDFSPTDGDVPRQLLELRGHDRVTNADVIAYKLVESAKNGNVTAEREVSRLIER